MLSLWLLYSGLFAGYWIARKEAFTSNGLASGVAILGSLTGFWITVLAVPEVIEFAKRGQIDHDAAGGVVAAGSFLVGILAGFAWARFANGDETRSK